MLFVCHWDTIHVGWFVELRSCSMLVVRKVLDLDVVFTSLLQLNLVSCLMSSACCSTGYGIKSLGGIL